MRTQRLYAQKIAQAVAECRRDELEDVGRGVRIDRAMLEAARATLPGGLRMQQALRNAISLIPGVGTGYSAAIGAALELMARPSSKAGAR
jgi:hypothetical protein